MSRLGSDYTAYSTKPQIGLEMKKLQLKNPADTYTTKVCTPIRSRMVPTQQLNSTPIQLRKPVAAQRVASPLIGRLNKQNQPQLNFAPSLSPNKFATKAGKFTLMQQSRGDADASGLRTKSPLLRDKTLTSGGLQASNSLNPFSKMSEGLKNYMQHGTLPDTPNQFSGTPSSRLGRPAAVNLHEYSSANPSSNDIDLKGSNSFKFLGARKTSQANLQLTPVTGKVTGNMFAMALNSNVNASPSMNSYVPSNTLGNYATNPINENRDIIEDKKLKNEVIDDIIKNCGRKQKEQQEAMRISNGNNAFGFGHRLSSSPDIASRKYPAQIVQKEDKFKEVMCMNNHNKKAKYRVVNQNPDEEDDNMFYCASCAVMLVQQGFRIQPIDQSQQNPQYGDGMSSQICMQISELTRQIGAKKERAKKTKETQTQKYQSDLDQVDSYYNSLISTIQQMRVKDRETILAHRNQNLFQLDDTLAKLNSASTRITSLSAQAKQLSKQEDIHYLETELSQLVAVCDLPEDVKSKSIVVEENVQDKFDGFINALYQEYYLKITINDGSAHTTQTAGGNPSVYFSFEKKHLNGQPMSKKLSQRQASEINSNLMALKEESAEQHEMNQESDESLQQSRKPFRNLFPEDSQEDSNKAQQEGEQATHQQGRQNLALATPLEPQQPEAYYYPEGAAPESDRQHEDKYDCYSPSFRNI